MQKIALVTDSTADLTEEMKLEYDVQVVPLKVRFGKEEYLDGEITSNEFYKRLQTEEQIPQTSQPSPEDFADLYKKLLNDYQEIISVHLSSGLSGTLNAAYTAKERLKGKIHIIDSKTISLGVGLMVSEAAKHIKEGLSSSEVIEKLTKARANIETLFTVDTLEYLQKGGRIGKVHGIVGTFLNIKPIIRVGADGIYHSFGKARNQEKALQSIVQAFEELSKGRKKIKCAVAHGAAYQTGQSLKESLEKTFHIKPVFTQVGPVIGVHTGPGTIGAALQYE